jgi:hypothetical protein
MVAYYNRVVDARKGNLADVEAFAARYCENACRLAVVLHAAKHGAAAAQVPLNPETAEAAIRLAEWWAGEGQRVLQGFRAAQKQDMEDAVLKAIRASRKPISVRDLMRRSVFTAAEEGKKVLKDMADRGLLIPKHVTTKGRPTVVYTAAEKTTRAQR